MTAGPPERAAGAPPGRAALARKLRAELGPAPERDDWPPVSIVVVNRDGADHLRLLLSRLAHATDYPQLELVLVDNASGDESVALARSAELPFPLTIVENESNLSFSDANDDGVDRARHDHVLLLNNDVEPFEPGWLKELVACLESCGAAAAGATLLHGSKHRDRPGSGYVLQHRGVRFAREAGFVVPVNAGDGEPLGGVGGEAHAPGATAACLLVLREAFERVGGFTTGFLWGWEDVDLGLKLASAGYDVVCSGRSVLFHNESSTRVREGREWRRRTKATNQRLFGERWAPQVRREYLLDRISSRGFWTDGAPPRLAVALCGHPESDVPARELADAVESEGWHVAVVPPEGDGLGALPKDADFVLVSDPSAGASVPTGVGCIAWIHRPVAAWEAAPFLRRTELALAAHPGVVSDLDAAGIASVPFPGAANPARVAAGLAAAVDGEGTTQAPGAPAPASLDLTVATAPALDCLVLGDHDEIASEAALALGERGDVRVAAAGAGWERWDGSIEALGEVPWERLPGLYATARIAVWESGAVARCGPDDAARLLDAALAGALPLTDDAELVRELLPDAELPTWSSAEELGELVDAFVADEHRRRTLVERCAAAARERHTWERRARQLIALLTERCQHLRFCLKLSRAWELELPARALRRSLEARGHACALQLADEWELLDGMTADVAVAIGDPGAYCAKPAQLNVLWTPRAPRPTQCDQWDLVLLPDADEAAALAAETPTPVAHLDLRSAADPADRLLALVAESAAVHGVQPRVVLPG